jgi:hypothetical protein
MLNRVEWVWLSRFKSITGQNTPKLVQFPHGIKKITEQGLNWFDLLFNKIWFFLFLYV